jgi:hypothetical protein
MVHGNLIFVYAVWSGAARDDLNHEARRLEFVGGIL